MSKRLGFLLETTGRDFSGGRTRSGFSLRKGSPGTCGEGIEGERGVRRPVEAGCDSL